MDYMSAYCWTSSNSECRLHCEDTLSHWSMSAGTDSAKTAFIMSTSAKKFES
jgi:hypothetical protein